MFKSTVVRKQNKTTTKLHPHQKCQNGKTDSTKCWREVGAPTPSGPAGRAEGALPASQCAHPRTYTQKPLKKRGSTAACSHSTTKPDGWTPPHTERAGSQRRGLQRGTNCVRLHGHDVQQGQRRVVRKGRAVKGSLGMLAVSGCAHRQTLRADPTRPRFLHESAHWSPRRCRSCYLLRRLAPSGGVSGVTPRPRGGGGLLPKTNTGVQGASPFAPSKRHNSGRPALLQGSQSTPEKTPPLVHLPKEGHAVTPSGAGSTPPYKGIDKGSGLHN